MNDKPFRPMLASPVDMASLRYPCIASVKLDGIRATDDAAPARCGKPICGMPHGCQAKGCPVPKASV